MTLPEGTRVRLAGGYGMEPYWHGGRPFHDGTVQYFIPSEDSQGAVVVRLDEPITVEGLTGQMLVLQLRYVGAEWCTGAVVHIELCDFEPEPETWQHRRRGKWVESHASLEVL